MRVNKKTTTQQPFVEHATYWHAATSLRNIHRFLNPTVLLRLSTPRFKSRLGASNLVKLNIFN